MARLARMLRPALAALGIPFLAGCGSLDEEPGEHGAEEAAWRRERMVAEQLAARGIEDPAVLAAMGRVERQRLVPRELRALAYEDRALAIGHGQTISQPFVVAFMSEALELRPGERVLEIGTGSGYQAAVLAEMGAEVYSIEIVPQLAARAERDLRALGYDGIHLRAGDGYRGWPEAAPFDAILLTAAPERVPQPLVEQLALGGRMVLPVGGREQYIEVLRRTEEGLERERTIPVRFVPMTGEARGR